MITRSIAIIPAVIVTFFNKDELTSMDNYLNILQSVQLPFALVPLIKFVGNKKVMNLFVLGKWNMWFATVVGVILFVFNFVVLFGNGKTYDWWFILIILIVGIIYMILIVKAICEPVKNLQELTEEEMNDHEYDQLIVDEG